MGIADAPFTQREVCYKGHAPLDLSGRTAKSCYRSPETAKAPCGTACPESALTMVVNRLLQKRWIVAAL